MEFNGFFFWWIINLIFVFTVCIFNPILALIIAVSMIPIFMHDLLYKFWSDLKNEKIN